MHVWQVCILLYISIHAGLDRNLDCTRVDQVVSEVLILVCSSLKLSDSNGMCLECAW